MAEQRVLRRLAAILAADVASYSRLMGENEEGALATRNSIVDPIRKSGNSAVSSPRVVIGSCLVLLSS